MRPAFRWSRRHRCVPAAALFLAAPALASASGDCPADAPWCLGPGLGLTWIPLAVVFQLFFLYAIQGGPAAFLGRIAGLRLGDWMWNRLQIGFLLAVALSFPALTVLTLIHKWMRPVGLLDLAIVLGIYWIWLERRPPTLDAANDSLVPEADAAPLVPAPSVVGAADAGGAAVATIGLPLAGQPARGGRSFGVSRGQEIVIARAVPTLPPQLHPGGVYAWTAPAAAVTERAPLDTRALIDRLMRLYMWDDIGLSRAFAAAQRQPPAHLVGAAEIEGYGAALVDAMRAIARHTISLYRYGIDGASLADILAAHAAPGFDEYAADLMQRLTYSVLAERQKLFIDQTDVEIFGDDCVAFLMRLAVCEARSAVLYQPATGIAYVPASAILQ
ncbi:MAG: hypothetical protein HZC24_01920 [Rhodocyclales bacterium]|nr:hypothetical protein [Rhodocyclales bacterium]